MAKFTRKSALGGLMLNRKEGQSITINHGEVIIEVVEIRGKEVRLAFRAARDVVILRKEQQEARDAGNSADEG